MWEQDKGELTGSWLSDGAGGIARRPRVAGGIHLDPGVGATDGLGLEQSVQSARGSHAARAHFAVLSYPPEHSGGNRARNGPSRSQVLRRSSALRLLKGPVLVWRKYRMVLGGEDIASLLAAQGMEPHQMGAESAIELRSMSDYNPLLRRLRAAKRSGYRFAELSLLRDAEEIVSVSSSWISHRSHFGRELRFLASPLILEESSVDTQRCGGGSSGPSRSASILAAIHPSGLHATQETSSCLRRRVGSPIPSVPRQS